MRLLTVVVLCSFVIVVSGGCHKKGQPGIPAGKPAKKDVVKPAKKAEKKPATKVDAVDKKSKSVAARSSGKADKKPVKAPPSKKSAMTSVIEDLTGKTTIDRGLKAQADIKRIAAKHNRDLNEALGE